MATPHNPNTFTDNPLDRASVKRLDKGWIEEQLKAPDTSIVPLFRLRPLILAPLKDGNPCDIGWVRPQLLLPLLPDDACIVFLGLDNGVSHFAADVSHLDNPDETEPFAGLGRFEDLRGIVPQLDDRDASILAQAKSMIDWHLRHGFCANCGARTHMAEAGYKRECPSCKSEHFPRTDPVVITTVVKDGKCLLGRGPHFPEGMFSALAGFIEPGESIEEAVAREVWEEVGIKVDKVHYHSTQPWPYPSSLMIGCIAEAVSTEINVDETEIAEARWFTREELAAAMARHPNSLLMPESSDGNLWVPPPMAIAHHLIRAFVEDG